MTTDVEKYEATADHDAVSVETAGARLDDEARDKLASSLESKLADVADEPTLSVPEEPVDDDQKADDSDDQVTDDDQTADDDQIADDSDQDADDSDQDADDSDSDDVDDADDSTDDKEAADESKKDSTPTLPEAYRRSLKAYQWSDEEIDAALANNPEQFTTTALRIHRTRNDEISKFAEAGRRLRQEPGQTSDQPKPDKQPSSDLKGLPAIDREALIEKYGNEEIVNAIASPVNDAIARINQILPELQAGVAVVRNTQRDTLTKTINDFFESESMASYVELYGKSGTERTPEQSAEYHKVLELADAILAGAAQQGRQLSFNEAMDAAHSDISKDFQAKAIRTEVKKKVERRSKSVSLKPSHSGKKRKSTDQPATRKELEGKTRIQLAKIFT